MTSISNAPLNYVTGFNSRFTTLKRAGNSEILINCNGLRDFLPRAIDFLRSLNNTDEHEHERVSEKVAHYLMGKETHPPVGLTPPLFGIATNVKTVLYDLLRTHRYGIFGETESFDKTFAKLEALNKHLMNENIEVNAQPTNSNDAVEPLVFGAGMVRQYDNGKPIIRHWNDSNVNFNGRICDDDENPDAPFFMCRHGCAAFALAATSPKGMEEFLQMNSTLEGAKRLYQGGYGKLEQINLARKEECKRFFSSENFGVLIKHLSEEMRPGEVRNAKINLTSLNKGEEGHAVSLYLERFVEKNKEMLRIGIYDFNNSANLTYTETEFKDPNILLCEITDFVGSEIVKDKCLSIISERPFTVPADEFVNKKPSMMHGIGEAVLYNDVQYLEACCSYLDECLSKNSLENNKETIVNAILKGMNGARERDTLLITALSVGHYKTVSALCKLLMQIPNSDKVKLLSGKDARGNNVLYYLYIAENENENNRQTHPVTQLKDLIESLSIIDNSSLELMRNSKGETAYIAYKRYLWDKTELAYMQCKLDVAKLLLKIQMRGDAVYLDRNLVK
ncbi:MAG TPA: hypothetical protein VEC06_09980 [Paucimonas sp.]|nr:hypothetical protein [Paucimonas sp.]